MSRTPDLAMRSEIEGRAKHRVQSSWHLQMRRHCELSYSVVKIFSHTTDSVPLRYTITVASRNKWKIISIHTYLQYESETTVEKYVTIININERKVWEVLMSCS